jgi:hypothetical protein
MFIGKGPNWPRGEWEVYVRLIASIPGLRRCRFPSFGGIAGMSVARERIGGGPPRMMMRISSVLSSNYIITIGGFVDLQLRVCVRWTTYPSRKRRRVKPQLWNMFLRDCMTARRSLMPIISAGITVKRGLLRLFSSHADRLARMEIERCYKHL